MQRDLLFLEQLDRFSDIGVFLLRAVTGAFLVYGVVDNIADAERMHEFAEFLAANGFPAPAVLAPFSVYVQFLGGVLLILGLLTRWAGLVISVHFVVAVVMVHWAQDFRGWWPALVLVFIGLQLALSGAGGVSLDSVIRRRRADGCNE